MVFPYRPQLTLAPLATTTQVVTTTTTTTTTYDPITLPSLPSPSEPRNTKDFPLYNVELPASVRRFPLILPNGAHATFADGPEPAHPDASASGEHWRMLRKDEIPEVSPVVDLADAVERYSRKRSYVARDTNDDTHLGPEPGTASSPPRKKVRGPTTVGGDAPPSPLPSPRDSPTPEDYWNHPSTSGSTHYEPAQQPTPPPGGSDLALTTLLSLPNLISHFSALPPPLQSRFLLTLLRHSPLPVLRTLHGVLTPVLSRDFLTTLPPELVSHILSYLPHTTLGRAACVSKAWRSIINSDVMLWRNRLQQDDLWYGGESERAFARALNARKRRGLLPSVPSDSLHFPHLYKTIYQSRHLTRSRWAKNDNPRHYRLPAHGRHVVTCLLISHGRIISAADDNSIHVYTLPDGEGGGGELQHSLSGHEGGVWALAVRGNMLVSGSTDRTVRIWDLQTGRCTHVFGGHTSTVRCLTIIKPEMVDVGNGVLEKWPERPLIATGSRDQSLRVWVLPREDEDEFSCIGADQYDMDPAEADVNDNPYHWHHLEGHELAVRALSARGRTLVSGSYDQTVRVWDVITGKCKWKLKGHQQKVYSVVYDPVRNQAYSGSLDGTIRIWDLNSGTCAHILIGHTSLVGLLGLTPSSLVSAAADSTLRIWDPITGQSQHTLTGHTGAIICFQADDSKVLSGSDGTLRLWDLQNRDRDGTVHAQDLLSGVDAVWQVATEGRWAVAASMQRLQNQPQEQTWIEVWDVGAREDSTEKGEEWISEPAGGMWDEDSCSEDELDEDEKGRSGEDDEDIAMSWDEEMDEDDFASPKSTLRASGSRLPTSTTRQTEGLSSGGRRGAGLSPSGMPMRSMPFMQETPSKPHRRGGQSRRQWR